MDINDKKYRNYEKTEVAIKDALIELSIKKRSIDRVTVKELCEVANISKSTFYLHYADIESIFESVGDKFMLAFHDMFYDLIDIQTRDFLIFIKQVFKYIKDANEIIKIGLNYGKPLYNYVNNVKKELEQAIIKSSYLTDLNLNKTQVLIEIKIVTSGIIDFIIELLKNNQFDQLDEYALIINDFLVKWVASLDSYKNNQSK